MLKGLLGNSNSSDPNQGLIMLGGVTGTVSVVGPEVVRGPATTHYQFTVDLTRPSPSVPPDMQASLRQLSSQLGMTTTAVDVYLDSQGRIRRFHSSDDLTHATFPGVPTPAAGSPVPLALDVTTEYFDFGTPVVITLPPPDQVTDVATLLSPHVTA